ncbi:MAG: hypothetical protein LIP16_09975 [Clostridium sp.]|nr:hypothetical protein [Clostridium sp.]
MMHNELRDKISSGKKAVGTFLEIGSTSMVECLALGGFDYIIIDTEHGPFETESVMEFVCASRRRNMTPLVRTRDASRPGILKNLDAGAMGLIIPDIHSVEEVKQVVEYGKYYPLGKRGVAFGRGCGYGMEKEQPMESYFEECNRETMIIPQCETAGCLENIETIASLPGVDGIFVGPYDLSTSLGKPGQFSDPVISEAIDRILRACKAAVKPCFIYADNAAGSRAYFQQGFDGVTLSMDALLVIRSMKKMIQEIWTEVR